MTLCRVLLVEDDPITLANLARKIEQNDHLVLAGAVTTCAQTYEQIDNNQIDVLLTDLDLPDGDGTQIITKACIEQPNSLAMVISVFGDERHVVRAIKAGATGYLLKDGTAHEIGDAITQLIEGFSPISPTIAHHLIKALHPAEPELKSDVEVELSDRELEVLTFAAKGYTYAEIAEMIEVSVNTVSSYTRRIYNKLAVGSKSEAIFEASRLGLMK